MLKKIELYLQFIEDKTAIFKRHHTRYFALNNGEMTRRYPNLYKEVASWYLQIFKRKPDIKNCSLLVDFFAELKNLKIEHAMTALQIDHKLKEGKVAKIGADYYAKGNPKLTNEICQSIYDKYGASYFDHFDKDWRNKEKVEYKGHSDIKVTKENINDFFEVKPKKATVKDTKPEIKEEPEVKEEPEAKEEVKEILEEKPKRQPQKRKKRKSKK